MPCYNSEEFISTAISSVLNQTYKNIELIIIDDGSKDSSWNIICQHASVDNRVVTKQIENSGKPAIPRNIGIKIAKGRYLAFLDSDDVMYPTKIEMQVNAMHMVPNAGICFHEMTLFRSAPSEPSGLYLGRASYKIRARNFLENVTDDIYKSKFHFYSFSSIEICGAHTNSVMIDRDVVKSSEITFDESLIIGEDSDLWLRLIKSYVSIFIDKELSAYRENPNSITKNLEQGFIGFIDVHRRNLLRGEKVFTIKEKILYRKKIAIEYCHLAYFYRKRRNIQSAIAASLKGFLIYPKPKLAIEIVKSFVSVL